MDSEPSPSPAAPVIRLTPGEHGQPPQISSEQLFQDRNTLRIEHGGSYYLLRITRENKLILTK